MLYYPDGSFHNFGFTQNKPVKNSAGMTMCYIPAGLYKRRFRTNQHFGPGLHSLLYEWGDGLLTLEQPPHKVLFPNPFTWRAKKSRSGNLKNLSKLPGIYQSPIRVALSALNLIKISTADFRKVHF